MRQLPIVWIALIAGCGGGGVPVWGVDTFTLDPTGAEPVGIQRWDMFDADWEASGAPRDHVCGAVVLLHPEPRTTDCPECVMAWSASPTLRETDCEDLRAGEILRVTAVGIGAMPEDLTNEDPHPGESLGAWVQIDDGGWLPHGWAYPEALDFGGAGGEWDGETIFTLWPDNAWPLE
ncbi:MAG: hypothetical protein EP330_24445 [Deltaproteobacteria bacterium]|nr:MAG: hypothetical protein EP330_24445 [Deltaproteobacteria bacterium]